MYENWVKMKLKTIKAVEATYVTNYVLVTVVQNSIQEIIEIES